MHRCRATLEPGRGTASRRLCHYSGHLSYNVCHLSYNEPAAVRLRGQALWAAFSRDHFAAFAPAVAAKPSC